MPASVKAEINKETGKIDVEAGFELKDRLLTIPGSRYDRDRGIIVLNLTWASCKQLRGIIGEDLEIGESLIDWAVGELDSRIEPCNNIRQATSISDSTGICDGLYDFQQAGAMFLVTAQQAILADPMGSGKTVQALAAARYVEENLDGSLPALIVCPNSMKRTWAREIEQWWPGVPVYVVQGTKAQRQQVILDCLDKPGFVVINWESVRLHSRLAPYGTVALRDCSNCNRRSNESPSKCERCPRELNQIPFKLAIVDEAHRMQDPQSKQTRAVWAAGRDANWKWAMTGTPLTNTPETLYPVLHFLNPLEWPTKTGFINRYTDNAPSRFGPGLDIFGLNENTKEEFFEIFDPRFRRMPKEIVLPQLPPIQYVRRDIDMGDEQARAYRTMAEDMVARDENGELIIAVNPISKLTRTIQYSSATLTVNEEGLPRMTAPSCKIDQLMNDLPDFLGAEESVVVFAVHRQLIEMAEVKLKEAKIPYSVIKGGQSENERQDAIDAFQSGTVPVILVVIAAGGVGITLTTGRIAIFLQRPWSNVDHQQAMGRVHRIGSEQHESIIIMDYITNRTVENYQLRALRGKADQLEAVVRDAETIQRILNGEDE